MGLIRNTEFSNWVSDSQPSDWSLTFAMTCEKIVSGGDTVCLIKGVQLTPTFFIFQENFIEASPFGYQLQLEFNLLVNDGAWFDKEGDVFYRVEIIVGGVFYFLQSDGSFTTDHHNFIHHITGIKEEDGLEFIYRSHNIHSIPYTGTLRVELGQAASVDSKIRGSIFSKVDIVQSTYNDLVITAVNTSKDSGAGGSATILASGINIPLSYSLDGLTYQPLNVFNALAAGSYTAYAKDSAGYIVTRNFAITADYSYGEWIRSTIATPAGLTFVASVFKRSYEGELLERYATDSMLVFDYPGRDDDYTAVFKGRSATLTLLTEDDDDFSDVFADDRSCYLSVTLDGADYFKGYVLINDTAKPYLEPFKIVSIQARCGIGELKEHKFLDEAGNKYRQIASVKDTLLLCLNKLDLGLKLRIAFNLYEDNMSLESCPLDQVYVDLGDYYDDNNILDCSKVIEDILSSKDAQLQMADCIWYLIRMPERTDTLKCWEYNSDGSFSALVSVNDSLLASSESVDFKAEQAVLQKTPAFRSMTVEHEYKLKTSIIPNGDMSQYDESLVLERSRVGYRYVNKRSLLTWQTFIQVGSISITGTREYPSFGGSNELDFVGRSYLRNQVTLEADSSQSFTLELEVTPLTGDNALTIPVQLIIGDRSYSGLSGNWEHNLTSVINYTNGTIGIPTIPFNGALEVRVYCSDRAFSLQAFNMVLLEDMAELPESRTYHRNINGLSRFIPDSKTIKTGDAPNFVNAGAMVRKVFKLSNGDITRSWGGIGTLVDNMINFYAQLMSVSRFRLDCALITTAFDPLCIFVDDLGNETVYYMFNGGTYLASIDEWEVQLLEIFGYGDSVSEHYLMIDEAYHLLIDEQHKLLI